MRQVFWLTHWTWKHRQRWNNVRRVVPREKNGYWINTKSFRLYLPPLLSETSPVALTRCCTDQCYLAGSSSFPTFQTAFVQRAMTGSASFSELSLGHRNGNIQAASKVPRCLWKAKPSCQAGIDICYEKSTFLVLSCWDLIAFWHCSITYRAFLIFHPVLLPTLILHSASAANWILA